MRIITQKRLSQWCVKYPEARNALIAWSVLTRSAKWSSIVDVRSDLPSADGVVVRSGRTVTVFNIRGNNYRLITAIHYNRQMVFVLRFLTHASYDRQPWKDSL